MKRYMSLIAAVVFGGASILVFAKMAASVDAQLTAADIITKNVMARGGAKAWRKINTMTWNGHIDINSTKAPVHNMPFVLKMKRPNKTRFEIIAKRQLSVRLFDGEQGWKMLPGGRDGMPRLKPYTKDEIRFAQDSPIFDGPLIDYQSKGITVTLEGRVKVKDGSAYQLKVTMPSGISHRIWIDTKTFLEVKYDRRTRNAFGMFATLSVTYRDYRKVNGVQIPFTIENGTVPGKPSYNMLLDKVLINTALSDREFTKPNIPHRNSTRIRLGTVPTGPNQHTVIPMHSSMAGAAGGH